MFGLFRKDPIKQLEKEYTAKLREARDLQRGGDVVASAAAHAEADAIRQKIEAAERETGPDS